MANLLPLMAFSAMLLAATFVHSQDSISFSVGNFTPNPAALTYQDDAHIPTDTSFLRLTGTRVLGGRTAPRPWSIGRVIFSTPVQLHQRSTSRLASFDTTIKFNITKAGKGAADGIAFFIAPFGAPVPFQAAGANLGVFPSSGTSNSGLLAVEFDTYSNPGDPDYPHIGIDIKSRVSKSVKRFDNGVGQVVTARISYDAITKRITVVASTATQTYDTLTYDTDLSLVLPARVQVGVSSSTGQNGDEIGIHDLLYWSFTSTLVKVGKN